MPPFRIIQDLTQTLFVNITQSKILSFPMYLSKHCHNGYGYRYELTWRTQISEREFGKYFSAPRQLHTMLCRGHTSLGEFFRFMAMQMTESLTKSSSLHLLQQEVTKIGQVVSQKRVTLDILFISQKGTCATLRENIAIISPKISQRDLQHYQKVIKLQKSSKDLTTWSILLCLIL